MHSSYPPQGKPSSIEASQKPDLNLIGTNCPMAFVKTRILLDKKNAGDFVDILYENTAANEPLVRSIEGLGHTVISRATINVAPQITDLTKLVNSSTKEKLQATRVKIQVQK